MIPLLLFITTIFNVNAYEVLKPASEELRSPIISYIHDHQEQFQEDLPTGGYECLDMYVIDINNDGQDEYVFLEYNGTANAITLRVLAKENNKIKEIRFPNTFNYFHEFVHPINHECQLFVKVDGVIYICFSRGTYDTNRDVYCWKNGIVSYCSSPFWIKQQLIIFDELCMQQDYRAAYIFLNDFEKECKDSLDAKTDLHILSKIAYAALHNNWLNQCMALLKKIKNDRKYKSLAPALKDEILNIEKLCQKKLSKEKDCEASNSFEWMLAYENKSSRALIADKRFNLVLSTITPDLLEYNFFGFKEKPDNIQRYFYWPNSHVNDEADKVSIVEKRYVAFSGRYPHCVSHRGFVWCDTQKNIGVLVLAGVLVSVEKGWKKEDAICIASQLLEENELPEIFFTMLKKWLEGQDICVHHAKFYNKIGAMSTIAL